MNDIDTFRADEAVCPYCGHEHDDSWEFFSGSDGDGSETTVTCNECDKDFILRLHVDVCYTSAKQKSPATPDAMLAAERRQESDHA